MLLNSLFHGLTALPTQGVWLSWENVFHYLFFSAPARKKRPLMESLRSLAMPSRARHRPAAPSAFCWHEDHLHVLMKSILGTPAKLFEAWSLTDLPHQSQIHWLDTVSSLDTQGTMATVQSTSPHRPSVRLQATDGRLKWITKFIADSGLNMCQTSAKLIMIANSLFGKGLQNTDSTLQRKVVSYRKIQYLFIIPR